MRYNKTESKGVKMKIAISCLSPLVQSSLEYFLKDSVTSEAECDFIISDDENRRDTKPLCLVLDEAYSHIRKPFNTQSLNEDLAAFYEKLTYSHKNTESSSLHTMNNALSQSANITDLESRIRTLCDESAKALADNIIALLKTR